MVRCFLAINLSDETTRFLSSSIHEWRIRYKRHIRWVRAENCHLTLKFLGEVEEALLPEIENRARSAASAFSPFEIELGAPGVFPNPRFPRVLWLGLKGDLRKLGKLQNSLEENLAPIGFEPEKRAFIPHITVGRVKTKRGIGLDLRSFLRTDVPVLRSKIDTLNLYQSILKSTGPVYQRLAAFPLKDGQITQ